MLHQLFRLGCSISSSAHLARQLTPAVAQHERLKWKTISLCNALSSKPTTEIPPPDAVRAGTADLCDVHLPDPVDMVCERKVQIVEPIFRDFGGALRAEGQITTVRCFENNPLVRKALEQDGSGKVLVVDGGGSMRCALLGDNLAEMACKNGWRGIIVNGCIRDSEDIKKMPLLVKALNTYPLKSSKRDPGMSNVEVSFGGVIFKPGQWIYADQDGILVSTQSLSIS